MKVKKTYDINDWVILDNARFVIRDNTEVVIGTVIDSDGPDKCFKYMIGEEARLINSDLVEVLEA